MSELRPINDWSGHQAVLTIWRPAARTMEAVIAAPESPVPPSYEQEQHLRSFRTCESQKEEMARLLIAVWEETGQCDIAVMGRLVTEHLRRHDTYHSWFDERDGVLSRHVLADPEVIEMEPESLGEVTAEEWRHHATDVPAPHDWGCFRFGILQRTDGFTCFASIDHLHCDGSVIAFVMAELHTAYRAALDGKPLRHTRPLSYLAYCNTQRQRMSGLTLADPGLTEWVSFLMNNHGRLPKFPLALGVMEDRCMAEYTELDIFDAAGMADYEAACEAAGARVIGGLLACGAMTERDIGGAQHYGVITPASTRRSLQAYRSAGWYMGVVPVDFKIGAEGFAGLAHLAQRVFDERLPLAAVPIERVLELAAGIPSIRPAATGGVMLSYNDMSRPPFTPQIARAWQRTQGRLYFNPGTAAQVAIWIFRTERGLALTAAYPANPTARSSIQRYVGALAEACRSVARSAMSTKALSGALG